MTARSPLLGPAIGLLLGIALGFQGVPPSPAAWPALLLALSPPLAPIAFASAGWILSSAVTEPEVPPDDPVPLRGKVVSVPDRLDGRVRFRLRGSDGRLLEVHAGSTAWPLSLGDRVRMSARLRPPPGARNPGGRDAARRLLAGGIALRAFAEGPVVREAPPSAIAPLEAARDRFAAAAERNLPAREAALVRAIGTGDRSALDPETQSSFARSGLAHVLAVSGLHLVVVALGLERLLRAALLRIEPLAVRLEPRRLAAAAVLPVVAVYALATGAGVPVLRAALASATAILATLLDREARPVHVLALALVALLALDPSSALDPSLQLSFAAVAGLAAWAGPLRRSLPFAPAPHGSWRRRIGEPLLAGVCATLAASAATAPVLALHFRQIPLLGLLANVAGVPVGSALTALSAAAAIASSFSPSLAVPLLLAARPLATALLHLSDAAAAPAWGALGIASPGFLGAAGAGALLAAATALRGRRRIAAAALACAFLLLPGPMRAAAARARGGLEVIYVSVGQGDCALLRLPDGSAVLVDAGGSPEGGPDPGARDVVPLLRDLGIRRLAAVFVSHPHPDHVLGLRAIAAAIPVERVFSNGDAGEGEAREILEGLAPRALAPGEAWERAGVRFEAAGGDRTVLPPNDASLVLRVVHGETAFLFTGDLERAGEEAAVARGGLLADVVKVPHHGSRTSSSQGFVQAVRPRWAVVSLGAGNRFRFPHEEAIARWREAGAEILRTDRGAVRFLSDGRTVGPLPAGGVLDPIATWSERPPPSPGAPGADRGAVNPARPDLEGRGADPRPGGGPLPP